jgi:hypothetical protein
MIAASVFADLLIRYLLRYLARIFARRAARMVVRGMWWLALLAFLLALGSLLGINPGDAWRSFLLSLSGRLVMP